MRLILASQSPRRRELMKMLKVPYWVRGAEVDESVDPALPPEEQVAMISRRKAAAAEREQEDVLIAADTIVVCQGRVLGKPRDKEQAKQMLSMLSGREHEVMTGVTVVRGRISETFTEITRIQFRALSEKEIDDYIATGEPMDKAGAYGIQGGAGRFVKKITGDYSNVVGLPMERLRQTLIRIAPELMEANQ